MSYLVAGLSLMGRPPGTLTPPQPLSLTLLPMLPVVAAASSAAALSAEAVNAAFAVTGSASNAAAVFTYHPHDTIYPK